MIGALDQRGGDVARVDGGTAAAVLELPPARSSSVVLPLPISANRIWRRFGKRIVINPKYAQWQREAGKLVMAARMGRFDGRYNLLIELPEKTRCDADNYIKALSDILQHTNVVSNDKHLRNLTVSRGDVPAKSCRITVSET